MGLNATCDSCGGVSDWKSLRKFDTKVEDLMVKVVLESTTKDSGFSKSIICNKCVAGIITS